jgi:hypothetical protein
MVSIYGLGTFSSDGEAMIRDEGLLPTNRPDLANPALGKAAATCWNTNTRTVFAVPNIFYQQAKEIDNSWLS